ncbi:nucleotidyltransferase domain-containing protein [Candidatus Pacearchaeota archaeon]|nr:nucleotidyltransferase domain-containing protein [Candidatus Pacearchaeota archaeon]
MVRVLTEREKEIINKKIIGLSLTQNESNILSRFVRPKLREISQINSNMLLNKLEYNQKAASIESKIKKILLENIPQVDSIIICGSAVQNNYKEYNDIDVIVATKKILTKSKKKKKELIEKVKKAGKDEDLNLDVQIYAKKSILYQYPNNPSLIYQLKDSKTIYGKLKIHGKIALSSLNLRMKLDWSEGLNIFSTADEIYYAIRNAILVLLLMNKKIDNYELRKNVVNVLGEDLVAKLRSNQASKSEKKLALTYLNLMVNYLETELKNKKWEKIEIQNP